MMPGDDKNSFRFKNFKARWFAPFTIYFDFESFLISVSFCPANPDASSTEVIEQHTPSGFALTLIENGFSTPKEFVIDSSKNCMTNFIKKLHEMSRKVYYAKRRFPIYLGQQVSKRSSIVDCWICEEPFGPEDTKVLDHCHHRGDFLGFAHEKCNWIRRTINFTPVIGHNIANYDLHHVCLALREIEPSTTIRFIPSTDEKYISMTFGVLIKTATGRDGKVRKIYEYLRFIDSFKFLTTSIKKLVANLPASAFAIFDSKFDSDQSVDALSSITEKGIYPYSYMTDRSKFAETELPPLKKWKNSLDNGLQITEEELQKAKTVFETFQCRNLEDYHNLYLKCDTLLLACVFEEFRRLCMNAYGLDCAHHYSASNLAGDAFLKICRASIQLLTNREHLKIVGNMIRGGLASVYDERYFKANNKYMENYNSALESTFGFMVDAYKLYGGIMKTDYIPVGDFLLVEVPLEPVLNTPTDSPIGYILEVDLTYPHNIRDLHRDFPLAPTKEIVPDEWLSTYQRELKFNVNMPRSSVPKLLQTVTDKKRYTLHYRNTQLYVQLGLVVDRVHRVLQFSQENWMEPYIRLNTEKRQTARNKFEENLFKLMNNSAYGKTCESKRRRMKLTLPQNADQVLQNVSRFTFKTFKIFGENLAAITHDTKRIYWDKPTIVGATILE